MNPFKFLKKKPKIKPPKGAAKLAQGGGGKGSDAPADKKIPRLAVVGHTGSGKTVYLAILHDVCKEGGEIVFQAYDDVTAAEILQQLEAIRGATRRFLTSEVIGTGKPSFPSPTTAVKELTFDAAIRGGERMRLSVLDYPGNAVSVFEDPSRKREVLEWIEESDGILFLIDPQTLASEADSSSQSSSFKDILARTCEGTQKRSIPVALVITKADQIDGFRDDTQTSLIPRSLDHLRDQHVHRLIEEVLSRREYRGNPQWRDNVRTVLNRLLDLLPLLKEYDPRFQIYFISSTGGTVEADGEVRPPDVLKPIGVREPLRDAIFRIGRMLRIQKRKKWAVRMATLCGLAALAICLWDGMLWWYSVKKATPNANDTIATKARKYERFDKSLFMWLGFLTPEVARASRDRATYARASALYLEFRDKVNRRSGESEKVNQIIGDLRRLESRNSRAAPDMRRLISILERRWDDRLEALVRQLYDNDQPYELELMKILDSDRRIRIQDDLGGGLTDPYTPIDRALEDLGNYTMLTEEPIERIRSACQSFLAADSLTQYDPRRNDVRRLEAFAIEILDVLRAQDRAWASQQLARLRVDSTRDFPRLKTYLGKDRTTGPAGTPGVDTAFERWVTESQDQAYAFNLSNLPRRLQERLDSNQIFGENRERARDYLNEVARWNSPGVNLNFRLKSQNRSDFHFHLRGADGSIVNTELDADGIREIQFRWKLGQPFAIYLSSNRECLDELVTIDDWTIDEYFSVFVALERQAEKGYVELYDRDRNPIHLEFEITNLPGSIPVLR